MISTIYVASPLLPSIEEYHKRIKAIFEARWLTNSGKEVKTLEEKLQSYLGVPHAMLVSSGTMALMIALKALRLSGEVITTPFTFPATTQAISWCGLTPVFCDIDPVTWNIDHDQIEDLIIEKTSAILPVHIFGYPCNTKAIHEIARRHNLKVIYDAAHAFAPAKENSSLGDITIYSTHATKVFHTCEGGILTFHDPHLRGIIGRLRNFGIEGEDRVIGSGINGKMSELHAGMGHLVLSMLDEELARRRILYKKYMELLEGVKGIRLQPPHGNINYFPIRLPRDLRDVVYDRLKEIGVFARKYFSVLCNDNPYYKRLRAATPNARALSEEVLVLPLHGRMTIEDVERICEVVVALRVEELALC